jgi:hypothetical protein
MVESWLGPEIKSQPAATTVGKTPEAKKNLG